MNTILWLDDIRNSSHSRWSRLIPLEGLVTWVKNYHNFKKYLAANGLPNAVCFDHDLGTGKSGMDAAKLLVDICLEDSLELPLWIVQSANPVGRQNIESYLRMYEKLRMKDATN